MSRRILERDHELTVLTEAVQAAELGSGAAVLVFGEAGIGKSSLVEAVVRHVPTRGRMLVGYCDDLATKRTLGPFRDLIGHVGTALTAAVIEGDRDRVFAALLDEATAPHRPTVLAVEDVHWADDATLEALRFLIRRVAGLPLLLLLTYRDDELGTDHPLHQLLGQTAGSPAVRRLPLRRLSHDAVRALSAGTSIDPEYLFTVTEGNPFFVAEVLATQEGTAVPATIVQAVQARVARLDRPSREALEQLAVVPSAPERWLVDALVPGGPQALLPAEQGGLLAVYPDRIEFRHELTRRAVADSVPAARRIELNRRVLDALVRRRGADLSRIVHHAAEAGDLDAIVGYGPQAAREAAGAGAHREAAAHYRLVLQQRDGFPPPERAELLEAYAIECYTIGAARRAVAAQREATEVRRGLGDPSEFGASLRWLSRMHWWAGDRAAAEVTAEEAVAVLAASGDTRRLALAYSNQSQLQMLAHNSIAAIEVGERAADLAVTVGDLGTLAHALTNVGLARWSIGDASGESTLIEGLQVALRAEQTDDALRAYVGIVWNLLDDYRLDDAQRYLAEAHELAEHAEHLGFLSYLNVERARLYLARSQWDDAVAVARSALNGQAPMECPALTVLGRVHVRRGQPGGDELLGRAWDLAVEINELQRIGPVAAARCEAAWLRGDMAEVAAVAEPVYDEARRRRAVAYEVELGYWLARAGQPIEPSTSDHPYALQAAGRWRDAATAWAAAGSPYEHAAALAASTAAEDLLTALRQLTSLGAEPLAARVRAKLRRLGVSGIPRGPYRTGRNNPAGLTARQLDVLRLLGRGFTNAQIAKELVLSVRTVDNHVAGVLDKLGVRSRQEAAHLAASLGVVPEPETR